MNIKTKYVVPAALLGVLMVGATSAYAFGGFNPEAFSNFTSEEQNAIQKIQDIREAAEEDVQQVLEDAGLTIEEIRDAQHAFGEVQREKLDVALESGDYDAYQALVAESPRATDLTEEVFDQLVEAHKLREAGDHKGARAIMEDLGLKGLEGHKHGFGGPGFGQRTMSNK